MARLLAFLAVLLLADSGSAAPLTLTEQMHHLRQSGTREWSEFSEQAEAASFETSFTVTEPANSYCLRIRQQDIKARWRVRLNDRDLGTLRIDENDMVVYLPVPDGAVKQGENKLTIDCPKSKAADDIRIGEIRLIDRPRDEVLNQSMLVVRVFEGLRSWGNGTRNDDAAPSLPVRITVLDEAGTLRDTGAESNNALAVRPGTIYTANGFARIPVEPGTYRVVVGRGFEYSIDSQTVTIAAGHTEEIDLAIRREVPTPGWVACDTHVHTLTHSGHGDCTVQERMITLAAEGIELPVATDHNVQIDHEPFAREMNVRRYFTPVIGNEVTTKLGHFNIFPADRGAPVPDYRGTEWPTIFDAIFGTPGVKAVILNHARDLHGGFKPFGSLNFNDEVGLNINGWKLRANAMETLNSSANQTDIMQLFHDWMAALNSGHQITPVGSSDSHDVARHFVGQGRTYIRSDDSDPGDINVAQAAQAFVDGKVIVSYGLFTELSVNGRHAPGETLSVAADAQTIDVNVRVLGPHWSQVDRIQLFANGVLVHERDLTQQERTPALHLSLARTSVLSKGMSGPVGLKDQFSIKLPRPKQDVHLVAIATGPGIRESWWRTAKPYQPDSPDWEPTFLSCSGAVWLDVDNDDQRSSAASYAATLVTAANGDLTRLLDSLAPYDSTVTAQAAHLYQTSLGDPIKQLKSGVESPEAQSRIAAATNETQAGIRRYLDAVRRNRIAVLSE
ncbi:MAG: CehA/McbA family metallohydrolase [Planctomycetota bacterium]|jgi:hypothetical protein